MKYKNLIFTAVLLLITSVNYFQNIANGSVRTVEFISIFAIGGIFGLLLTQLINAIRLRKK